MILEYSALGGYERKRVEAEVTTEHPASSYGIPVIVLEDGTVVDLLSWMMFEYTVIEANEQEKKLLGCVFHNWGTIMGV